MVAYRTSVILAVGDNMCYNTRIDTNYIIQKKKKWWNVVNMILQFYHQLSIDFFSVLKKATICIIIGFCIIRFLYLIQYLQIIINTSILFACDISSCDKHLFYKNKFIIYMHPTSLKLFCYQ